MTRNLAACLIVSVSFVLLLQCVHARYQSKNIGHHRFRPVMYYYPLAATINGTVVRMVSGRQMRLDDDLKEYHQAGSKFRPQTDLMPQRDPNYRRTQRTIRYIPYRRVRAQTEANTAPIFVCQGNLCIRQTVNTSVVVGQCVRNKCVPANPKMQRPSYASNVTANQTNTDDDTSTPTPPCVGTDCETDNGNNEPCTGQDCENTTAYGSTDDTLTTATPVDENVEDIPPGCLGQAKRESPCIKNFPWREVNLRPLNCPRRPRVFKCYCDFFES